VPIPNLNTIPPSPKDKTGWPWNEKYDLHDGGSGPDEKLPLVSIVTPSFNQGQYIEETIRSVLLQRYPNLEYIVVDGGSKDNSVEIIQKYEKWLAHFVSESDQGQANAINKGWQGSTGQILAWINSDDIYLPGTLKKVSTLFYEHPQVDFIFSHCLVINEKGRIINMIQGKDPEKFEILSWRNFIPQPTVFFRKKVLQSTGYLNEKLNLSMDFDYWRRISKSHKMKLINDIFACFRLHNESKTSLQLKQFRKESKRSFFTHGGTIWSPYYFETFFQPWLMSIFIRNPIVKRLFYRGNFNPEK